MTSWPRSIIRKRPHWLSPIWLVPLLAAVLAGVLIKRSLASRGDKIEIVFKDAAGLKAGKTDILYRGIKVGELEDLALSDDQRRIIATARLVVGAEALARKGARFWIVRPQVSAGGVKGLSAIVSGDYIAASPGKGDKQDRFEGLEEPPAEKMNASDLEITLVAGRLTSRRGAPVYYRGLKVGKISEARLSPDARTVRMRALIRKEYKTLVRENSQFWNAGGLDVNFGLFKGLDVRANSIDTLVEGGIAFATPDAPGKPVADGKTFPLNDKAQDEWKKWAPKIEIQSPPKAEEEEQPGED